MSGEAVNSPMATEAFRNRLARRPLHLQHKKKFNDDQKRTSNPEADPVAEPEASGSSPPSTTFTTSSPVDGAGVPIPNHDGNNLGLSLIETKVKKQVTRPIRGPTKKAPPFTLDDDKIDKESNEESDPDQPSGKVTIRYVRDKGTVMTPRNIKFESANFDQGSSAYFSSASILVVILIIGLAIFMAWPFGSVVQNPDMARNWNESVKLMQVEVGSLKADFPGQNPTSWRVISSSLRSILKEDPRQPSVFLLVQEEGHDNEATVKCLGQRLVQMGSKIIKEETMNKISPHFAGLLSTKENLRQALNSDLSSESAFLLHDLQDLPGESAMALHAFTDNLNAPFKQAVIVLTMKVSANNKDTKLVEDLAEDILLRSWSGHLDEDRITPILSRITVSVIMVVKEENIKNKCA